MKIKSQILAALCIVIAISPAHSGAPLSGAPTPVAPAPADELGFTLDLGYDSEDVWQGVRFGENWVSGGIAYDLKLNDTSRILLDGRFGSSANDRVFGIDASYQRLELGAMALIDLEVVELGLGYRWFHQMGDADFFLHDGHQVGLTLAKTLDPITLGLGSYYDFESEGWIFNADASAAIPVNDWLSIAPSAGVVYSANHDYWDDFLPPLDGFVAVNLRIALVIKLSERASLVPYVAARLPLGELDDEGASDLFYGGVRLSYSF